MSPLPPRRLSGPSWASSASSRPRLRLHLCRSLLERQIVQYHLTGSETLGRGPIIVLLDKSTSMDKDNRDIWAAAVALALMQHAHQEKRPFALVAFTASALFAS